ncbi:MAG: zinc ribbon domain-containing protein [Gammaproteobacteria bacterium]|nr:zinc ribbon domain-containing protein [Gammaproteobacteria bacterium]MDH5654032.1 zinc ribbon domain-containing protein [Gammaproteobacteria bacterium]
MKCTNCQTNVDLSARFCPSCGTAVTAGHEVISQSEVTIEWLINILKGMGYIVKPVETAPDVILATKDGHVHFHMQIFKDMNLIGFQSVWEIKKPSWLNKDDFLAALNTANSKGWLCSVFTPDSLDMIYISSYIYPTESISNRDIMLFVKNFNDAVILMLQSPELDKYMP